MRASLFNHFAGIVGAAALLAACGGPQAPQAAYPDTVAQRVVAVSDHGGSWMSPDAHRKTLLYAAVQTSCCASGGKNLFAFVYPSGRLVGKLNVTPTDLYGICSDAKGDIFVTSYSDYSDGTTIFEYAHAGTEPIATLNDPWNADACSVDPTTGNLAVANWYTNGQYINANVIVYNLSTEQYTGYSDPELPYYKWCAYDDKGNLYVDSGGFFTTHNKKRPTLAILPKGQSKFTNVTVKTSSQFIAMSLQWYNGNLVVAGNENAIGPETLLSVRIKGTEGDVVGTTTLQDHGHGYGDDSQFVIAGNHVISGGYPGNYLHKWQYPKGGMSRRNLATSPPGWWYGLAMSAYSPTTK